MVERLLRWLCDASLADAIAGDLCEQRHQRARVSPGGAAVWYWRTSLGLAIYLAARRMGEAMRNLFAHGFRFGGHRGELRQAIRSLRRTPWYSLTAIGVIALSMALAISVFAVVDGVLFRPLPYRDAHEIHAVSGVFDDDTGPPPRIVRLTSPRERHAWQRNATEVRLTLLGYSSVAFEDGDIVRAGTVDRDFLAVFGVRLLMGGFTADHFTPDRPIRPIVISHHLWQTRFGSAPDILGRVLPPGFLQPPLEIVGVLDRDGFVPPRPGTLDAWVRHASRVDALFPDPSAADFGERIGTVFVRVASDRLAEVEAALDAAVTASRPAAPLSGQAYTPQQQESRPYDSVDLIPLERLLTTRERPVLSIVFATALGLLALVLLNAAALAAARAQQRLREVAVRRSLGARAGDLLRQALAEQALLVAAGAVLGLVAAPWLLDVAMRRLPPGLNLIKPAAIDWRAAAFAGLVSAATSIAVAALAVRFAIRHTALAPMLAGGRWRPPAQVRMGRWLVAGQIGVGFALILGGVLFLTSLGRVWREDPGVRDRDAAILRVMFGDFAPPPVAIARAAAIAAALRQVPGVAAAGAFDQSLFQNAASPAPFRAPTGAQTDPRPSALRIGPGFFQAAAIQVLQGRLPSDAELASNAPVLVVSKSVAERYWPGRNALGQTLRDFQRDWTVIGVVRDVRIAALDVEPVGTIFAASSGSIGSFFFVAFEGRSATVLPSALAAITRANPAARVGQVRRIEDAIAQSIQPRRISTIAASAFALAAVVLMAVGLFGLVAQTTGWRTHELGVRFALGATPGSVLRLVLTEQLGAVLAGITAGAFLALWAVPLVGSYLYGIGTYDVRPWIAAIAIVLATAALGAFVPALRASRVDPVRALRTD